MATFLIAVILLAGTGGGSPGIQADDRPQNSTTSVEVEISHASSDHGGISLSATWATTYPARSAAEARRARNSTLNVSWFRGDEELTAFRRKYPDTEERSSWQQVRYQDTDDPHGEITVITGKRLHVHFGDERDRIVIGPQLAANLTDGDTMTVRRNEQWKPAEVSTPATESAYWHDHQWRIGSDPSPRFVFNESAVPEREKLGPDDQRGYFPIGGLIVVFLPWLFILLVVAAAARTMGIL